MATSEQVRAARVAQSGTMQKVDAAIIASTLAYCEAHCDTDEETKIVEWITEHIADAIKREHPRFKKGLFEVEAMPIRHRGLRAAIRNKLGIA